MLQLRRTAVNPNLCVCVTPYVSVISSLLTSHSVSLTSRLISASILGPVFGNQDQFLGLAIFLDTFRNDLHGMDVSVCVHACVPK